MYIHGHIQLCESWTLEKKPLFGCFHVHPWNEAVALAWTVYYFSEWLKCVPTWINCLLVSTYTLYLHWIINMYLYIIYFHAGQTHGTLNLDAGMIEEWSDMISGEEVVYYFSCREKFLIFRLKHCIMESIVYILSFSSLYILSTLFNQIIVSWFL